VVYDVIRFRMVFNQSSAMIRFTTLPQTAWFCCVGGCG